MQRKHVVGLSVLVPLGLIFGFLLRGWTSPLPVVPPPALSLETDPPAESVPAEDLKGWCCGAQAEACFPQESAVTCLQGGGRTFARDFARCQDICTFLTTQQQ